MTASTANKLLLGAFLLATISVYELPFLGKLDPVPRLLWTALLASAIGLVLYRVRRTGPRISHLQPTAQVQKPIELEPAPSSVFDFRPAEWRMEHKPSELTLHDLFLLDFKSVPQNAYGAIYVDKARTVSVQYGIHYDLSARAKFLSFYVGRDSTHTAATCEYLSRECGWLLANATQLLIKEKLPGESGTVSTKETVFSGRVFVYNETYLPAEATVNLSKIYRKQGLSVIFRSVDYLSTKRMEASLLKLRREKGPS